jgi:hypothetical protein
VRFSRCTGHSFTGFTVARVWRTATIGCRGAAYRQIYMKLGSYVIWGVAMSLSVVGCQPGTLVGCAAALRYAISLTVVDSLTGAAPAATSTIVATSGVYAETDTNSTGNPMDNTYAIGLGRSGTFALLVTTPGYADWSASRVIVGAGDCGVPQTVALVAKLQR